MSSLPETTVICSMEEVPKIYSPFAITPIVAGHSGVLNAIDFTLPLKYSFTLNIGIELKKWGKIKECPDKHATIVKFVISFDKRCQTIMKINLFFSRLPESRRCKTGLLLASPHITSW